MEIDPMDEVNDKFSKMSNEEKLKYMFSWQVWKNFFDSPYVRHSATWAFGVGSVLAAHKLRQYRGNFNKAVNGFFLGFPVTMFVSFTLITQEAKKNRYMLAKAMEAQGIKYDSLE